MTSQEPAGQAAESIDAAVCPPTRAGTRVRG